MPAYKVRGTLVYDKFEMCECVHCRGHNGGERKFEVDLIVDAKDDDEARRRADILSQRSFDTEEDEPGYEWKEGPFIEICGEDVQMRRLGMPELFQAVGG